MAGFAVMVWPGTDEQERSAEFGKLAAMTARYKGLEFAGDVANGVGCTAAKLDSPASLHLGITHDEPSGSWILAAGTLVPMTGSSNTALWLRRLLDDFLARGERALEDYDGHFGMVIYDGRDNSLSVISDAMGLFAMYYAWKGPRLLVSTSALALAKLTGAPADAQMIDVFLRTGRSIGAGTFWGGVRRILPATVLRCTANGLIEQEYWMPQVDERIAGMSMAEALDTADEKISSVYRRALPGNEMIWADLTGGFDTRVTTMYLDRLGLPFTAYCVGHTTYPDVVVSRLVSETMGWRYRHFNLPDSWDEQQRAWFDLALGKGDGLLNVYQLAQVLQVAQERSREAVVGIPGGGVDEWRYHIFGANNIIPALARLDYRHILNTRIVESIPEAALRQNHSAETRRMIIDHLQRYVSKYADAPTITQIDIAFLRYRHPVHAGAYLSAQSGIMRLLAPFCFKELVNFGFSFNHFWRIAYDFRFVRHLLEHGNPRLANIEMERGGPTIPIRLNTLHRFNPLWLYLADHFVGRASNLLLGRRLSLPKGRRHSPVVDAPPNPAPGWRMAWLRWADEQDLLTPGRMCSGGLYNPAELRSLVIAAQAAGRCADEFLDRVITIELALRQSGTALN